MGNPLEVGQAAVASNLGNTAPVPVKWRACRSSGYFEDSSIESIAIEINLAIKDAVEKAKGRPIIPFPKIGEGCSRMSTSSPLAHKLLKGEISKIMCHNFVYVYTTAVNQTSTFDDFFENE